uniref:Uncharacterized protein n=2 Tax=Kalanchoe fedtschenkoi TaxID=63787 RepID=A0A7N0ZTJ4_KALFE
MASRTKSTLPETPHRKTSPATPSRTSKLGRGLPKTEGDSPSSLHISSRTSLDRPASRSANYKSSPDVPSKSVAAKPLVDRRFPRPALPSENTHEAKESDNQVKWNDLQENLKRTKLQLALLEKEKALAFTELKEAQRLAEAANEKLSEALMAQKRAEEDSEIEKFRALEIEQIGIEITQKKEEEWMKEIEIIKNQHDIDVAALLSTTHELQRLKEELSMISDAKNQALSHADDATKIAEVNAEKAEILSKEISSLRALLDSKVESQASDRRMFDELKFKVESMKKELERNIVFEKKVAEQDAALEQIKVELEAARMAEAYAHNLVKECNERITSLECLVEEASQSERSASEYLIAVTKQLESTGSLLQESESNISFLKEKIYSLQISLEMQKKDLEESQCCAVALRGEVFQLSETVRCLTSDLHAIQEENLQALNNEKLAASNIEKLLEEKNRLMRDLEISKDENEKSKKVSESLAAALHEVSLEAREAKEGLKSSQAENKELDKQIEDLNNAMKAMQENYESMLEDAKHEIHVLMNIVEHSRNVFEDFKAEWLHKEDQFAESLKRLKDEKLFADKEMQKLKSLLEASEGEALAEKEESARLGDSLKKTESEMIFLQESLGEATAESLRLKETLMEKEIELQIVIKDNEELRNQEAASRSKVDELTKLLQEANAKKKAEENADLTDSDKDYDLLPKVVEFSVDNGNARGREDAIKVDLPSPEAEECKTTEKTYITNYHQPQKSSIQSGSLDHDDKSDDLYDSESKKNGHKETEGTLKMWESCKINKKEYYGSSETEQHRPFDDEADSRVEGSDSFNEIGEVIDNLDSGSTSPSKQPKKKMKKPLLSKFGSLLKKKSSPSNQR